jgi:hypothetical protein
MRIICFFELLEPDSVPICNVQSHVMMENKDLPIVTGLETGTSSSTIAHSRVPDGILVMLVSDPNIKSANYSCLQIEGMVALSRLGEMGCDISMYVSAGLPVSSSPVSLLIRRTGTVDIKITHVANRPKVSPCNMVAAMVVAAILQGMILQ